MKNLQAQLDKIQNNILMIDMHRSTIETATIDLSVLEALKASGDTLRQMGVSQVCYISAHVFPFLACV